MHLRKGGSARVAERSPLPVVTAALFLDFVSLTVAIPLLPFWAERLGASPLHIGAMITAYGAAQLAFTPILGAMSDRFGRKPVIVVSLVLSAASFAMTALAASLTMLYVARIVGGLGASIVGAAQAVVADRIEPSAQARAMGYIGAAIGVAHVVGPAAGSGLALLGPAVPFWFATVLTLGNVAMVAVWLSETASRRKSAEAPAMRWSELLRSHMIRRLSAITLVLALVTVSLETSLGLFTNRSFGWEESQNALLFAYLGIVVVIIQIGVVGKCAAMFGEVRLLGAGLVIGATGLLLLGAIGTPAVAMIAIGLIGIGAGIMSPLLPALLSMVSPPDHRGAVLGLAQSFTAGGRLVGPLLSSGLFTLAIGLPFAVVGALLLACLLLLRSRPAVLPADGHDRTASGA